VHIAGSVVLMLDLGYWQEFFIPTADVTIPFGPVFGAVVTLGWLVWLINSYNFMDGIDGIAGIQAVVAGAAWAVLAAWLGLSSTFLFSGVLASAALGFLIHNWAPARIFMGDVGSAFLGFTLAAIPLLAGRELADVQFRSILPAVAVLFVWYFVFDSLLTFFRRLLRGHKVWEAHREHIYQRMIISGWNHSQVALIYAMLAGLLSITVILAIIFSGKFPVFALFSLVIPTTALIYLGGRKKD
jgi:Fuc2NAc and GlcNAc transferase